VTMRLQADFAIRERRAAEQTQMARGECR
jgi:hypothetical protein